MRTPTVHAVHGDRILVTAEVPSEAVVCVASHGRVAITLDADDWRQVAVDVLSEIRHADRCSDPDAQLRRIETGIRALIHRALESEVEPMIARRRAVSSVLHRLGDMVAGSQLASFAVAWDYGKAPQEIELTLQTKARTLVRRYQLTPGGSPDGD